MAFNCEGKSSRKTNYTKQDSRVKWNTFSILPHFLFTFRIGN